MINSEMKEMEIQQALDSISKLEEKVNTLDAKVKAMCDYYKASGPSYVGYYELAFKVPCGSVIKRAKAAIQQFHELMTLSSTPYWWFKRLQAVGRDLKKYIYVTSEQDAYITKLQENDS